MTLSSRLLLVTASFALSRAARERHRQLERDLAAYTSDSDLADLSAMMERYPDGQTAEMRAILGSQSLPQPRRQGLRGVPEQVR